MLLILVGLLVLLLVPLVVLLTTLVTLLAGNIFPPRKYFPAGKRNLAGKTENLQGNGGFTTGFTSVN